MGVSTLSESGSVLCGWCEWVEPIFSVGVAVDGCLSSGSLPPGHYLRRPPPYLCLTATPTWDYSVGAVVNVLNEFWDTPSCMGRLGRALDGLDVSCCIVCPVDYRSLFPWSGRFSNLRRLVIYPFGVTCGV